MNGRATSAAPCRLGVSGESPAGPGNRQSVRLRLPLRYLRNRNVAETGPTRYATEWTDRVDTDRSGVNVVLLRSSSSGFAIASKIRFTSNMSGIIKWCK